MKFKKNQSEKVKPADEGDATPVPPEILEKVSQNITCSYGIHRGNFPIAGMKVKEARVVLKKLMKVSDDAAAVINGQVVSEDTVISAETTMLSFVKPSAVKGSAAVSSETITIKDRFVEMPGKKIGVDRFCGLVSDNTTSGMQDQPIPDNVKWIVRSGKVEVYIVELKPELRWIKWVADDSPEPYGEGATYLYRKLATPYVIMKATFQHGKLGGTVELFYRNTPLECINDELYYSNLLNVSNGAYGCYAWFCTQYLNVAGMKGPADILTGIISHVFGGGFNLSSESHEGSSCFTLSKKQGVDKRVTDVNKWEQESEKDPRFVLDVKWHPVGVTVRQLIEKELGKFHAAKAPDNAKALGNLLLAAR